MTRILIATSDRQAGGIERALRDQLALLQDMAEAEISILSPASHFADHAKEARIPVHQMGQAHRVMARYLPALAFQRHRRTPFDIILCHNGFLARALKPLGGRLIGICHNDKPHQFHACDELVCLTEGGITKAKDAGWDTGKLHHIGHYHEGPIKAETTPINRPLRVGAAGRMVGKKNLAGFIDIAAEVKQRQPDIIFECGGRGEDEQALAAYNASKGGPVTFRGWVDFTPFLQSLDLFIIPSFDEPFGFVFPEAMSHGVGILASDSFGANHCLDKGQVAPIFHATDSTAFADKICELANNEAALQALKAACLTRAKHPLFAKDTAATAWRNLLFK